MRSLRWSLTDKTDVLIRKELDKYTQRKDDLKAQGENSHLQVMEKGLTRKKTC